jgi:lysophospholipase L1-like esterase
MDWGVLLNKTILGVLAVAAVCVVTLLIGEGINAVARWSKLDGSVTYHTYMLIKGAVSRHSSEREGPLFTRLLERDEIDALIPKLKAAGVALGNSDYYELMNPVAAVNTREGGCTVQKPNVRKTMTYLRSNLFNPLDPLTIFYDSDRNLDPEIRKLIDTYGLRLVAVTTNEQGERTTVPALASDRKVIIAGDSVANGAGIDDSETISSQLQALDPTRQYINLGIAGVSAAHIICALDKAAGRYKGQIEELIYVYCENDFTKPTKKRKPYGTPEEVVSWLKDFVKTQGIAKVTVVYAPSIYNVVPQYTRFRQYGGYRAYTFARERAALAALVAQAGFEYIDISDVALAEAARAKTQFAALSVFSDHSHLSPYGTARLVERLRADTAPH